jgi:hypothetical protein
MIQNEMERRCKQTISQVQQSRYLPKSITDEYTSANYEEGATHYQ